MIKLFGANLKCVKYLGLCLGLFGCPCKLVFQIDWLPYLKELNMQQQEVVELSLWHFLDRKL